MIFVKKQTFAECRILISKIGEIITIKTLVAICIAFEIDIATTQTLLCATGYSLNLTDRTHFAYYYLITHHSGKNINECNNILKILGINEKHLLHENSK
jgi:uncharacterized protein (DUF4213/DUF364 family)